MITHVPVLSRPLGFVLPLALAIGGLVGLIALDRYLAHGLSVSYFVTSHGQRSVLLTQTEHRVAHESETRALGTYAQGWDFRRFEAVQEAPPLDIVFRGTIEVEGTTRRTIEPDATGTVEVWVDGVQTRELAPGRHRIEMHWRDEVKKNRRARFAAYWGLPHSARIAASAFTPETGSWPSLRIAAWGVGAPSILLLCLLSLALHKNRAGFSVPAVRLLSAVGVLVLALGLRGFDYDLVPDFRDNGDELFAAWNGYSLLSEGTTRGWSLWWRNYGDRVKVEPRAVFGSSTFQVITPYFEHPPLMHLLVGAAAKLGGARHYYEARHHHTRLVAVGLSVLCTALVMLIGHMLSPKSAAPYLAGLLYAVIPNIALQGRVVKEEGLLTFLLLLGTVFYLRYRERGTRHDLVIAAVLMGLCPLAKVTGLVLVCVLVMWLTAERAYRDAALALGVGLSVASLLLVYGAAIDWDTFWYATVYQAQNRPRHFNLLLRFFDDGLINQTLIGRGFLLFLWLAFASWAARQATSVKRIVLLPLLVYLFAIGVPSGNWTFGWYAQPLYPWLCLGAGAFVAEAFERPSLWHGTLVCGVLLMYAINFTMPTEWARDPHNWPALRRAVTLYVGLIMTPYALYEAFPKSLVTLWLGRVATGAALCGFVGISSAIIVRYDAIRYTHEDFDRIKFFDR